MGGNGGQRKAHLRLICPVKLSELQKKKKKRNKPSANRWKKVILVLSIESEARKANSKKNR